MSVLKKILLVLVVVVVGFVGYAATRPDAYRVERSRKIAAPAAVVFAHLDNFKSWSEWSPWDKRDPDMKRTFDGPSRGVGAHYAWQGNDKVGEGKMTITEATAPTAVAYRLEFIKPFASVAQSGFAIRPEGPRGVDLTWSMDGNNNLMGKIFGLFMNMDKLIGDDFEAGLTNLKVIAETDALKVEAEQAAAQAAAAQAAAAAAAQAAASAAASLPPPPPPARAHGHGKKR